MVASIIFCTVFQGREMVAKMLQCTMVSKHGDLLLLDMVRSVMETRIYSSVLNVRSVSCFSGKKYLSQNFQSWN